MKRFNNILDVLCDIEEQMIQDKQQTITREDLFNNIMIRTGWNKLVIDKWISNLGRLKLIETYQNRINVYKINNSLNGKKTKTNGQQML